MRKKGESGNQIINKLIENRGQTHENHKQTLKSISILDAATQKCGVSIA